VIVLFGFGKKGFSVFRIDPQSRQKSLVGEYASSAEAIARVKSLRSSGVVAYYKRG